MTLELIIRPEAEEEMAEAYNWYEERLQGLGSEFLLNVDATLNSIFRNHHEYPVVYKNIRRALTRRFPYQILFVAEGTLIVVVAVFHARRDPKHWQERT